MTKEEHIKYWLNTAEEDWKVANHLFEKGDYSWCLFISHLVIEKYLKALYVQNVDRTVPYIHDLVKIAKKAKIEIDDENKIILDTITTFNLNTRYDDYKKSFYKKCTKIYTKEQFSKIEEVKKWIMSLIKY
ncbi:MAG: HEPN domain-containing protein [Candidatus Cloacimonadota bacterium]|nr:HEPN domain-containing protein [Candidatus Cloacimonadota bacterium]